LRRRSPTTLRLRCAAYPNRFILVRPIVDAPRRAAERPEIGDDAEVDAAVARAKEPPEGSPTIKSAEA
jgi:hypothetical protein